MVSVSHGETQCIAYVDIKIALDLEYVPNLSKIYYGIEGRSIQPSN